MPQTEQPLASRSVRKCAQCGSLSMLDVSTDKLNRFQCTNCGKTIELWGFKDAISGIAVFGGMLSLLLLDDHLFWLLLHLLANPLQEFPAMLKDGILAPLLIPLGLIAFNILLVGIPLMGLATMLQALFASFRNPIQKGVEADAALRDHKFKPQEKRRQFTVHEFFRSLMIAGIIHAGFIAIAWSALTFMGRPAFEGVVEGALPGLLLSGGLLFGARRWMVAVIWVFLLPLSGFIVAILTGQLF